MEGWTGILVMLLIQTVSSEDECHFVRYGKSALYGYNNKVLHGIKVEDCELNCRQTKEFVCKSFDYALEKKTCFLSAETRETKPEDFGRHNAMDYYGKVCSDPDVESSGETGPCDDGWVWFRDSCYFFYGEGFTRRDQLFNLCKEKGAHMIFVDDQEEFAFVTRRLQYFIGSPVSHNHWFTGGVYTDGQWAWQDSNYNVRSINYFHWLKDMEDKDGQFLILLNHEGQWGYARISGVYGLNTVCEKVLQ